MLAAILRDLETRLALGLRSDAAQVDLREATARILLALDDGRAAAMSDVARRVGRDPSTATRFVDRAVADGLLTRQAGTDDRRRRLVALTPEGSEAARALRTVRARRAETLLESILSETGLGEGQVEWFLQAMLAGLERQGGVLSGGAGS